MPFNSPIALTIGEPSGIAGEITAKAWQALRHDPAQGFFVIGDPDYYRKQSIPVCEIGDPALTRDNFLNALPVLPLRLPSPATPGAPDPKQVAAIADSICMAVDFVKQGKAGALVTNPIHKSAMRQGGFDFPGHTEYLAHLDGAKNPVMMLINDYLRVVPLTVHVALGQVPQVLAKTDIAQKAEILRQALRKYFGIKNPSLALSGLNPHAGEDGHFGEEEDKILKPLIQSLQEKGIDIKGPYAADTMFTESARKNYDAALCCYHDQALIPVKTLDFWNTVNVTLGLSFIRTSPDHGTALDIAGKGVARADSLIAAIKLARKMAYHAS